jgi:hypothetical protein
MSRPRGTIVAHVSPATRSEVKAMMICFSPDAERTRGRSEPNRPRRPAPKKADAPTGISAAALKGAAEAGQELQANDESENAVEKRPRDRRRE